MTHYKEHAETVYEILKQHNGELNEVLSNPVLTYQELYKDKENSEYFGSIGDRICNYYKLKPKY